MGKFVNLGRLLATTSAGVLMLMAGLSALAQDQPAEKLPAPATGKLITLEECLHIAYERQPALAAYRASLASAQTAEAALQQLRGPAVLISPDLPIRRHQASIGVTIAEATLRQAELDTADAVTRMYYTVMYAREQLKVADQVTGDFKFYRDQVKNAVMGKPKKGEKAPPKEWTTDTVDKLEVYHGIAASRREEALKGIERAKAALREAMGVGCDFVFDVPEGPLPSPVVQICKDDIIAMAKSQRGEVIRATRAVEIFNLEIDAQCKHMCPGAYRTFASGADIHADPVPAGSRNGEYHPGAVGPEMPVELAGSRSMRMERARDLSGRAAAVAEKAENLVVLEAEDTYLRWRQAADQAAVLRTAAESGERLAKNTSEAFRGGQKVTVEDVLTNGAVAAQARSAYNEALLHQLITLSALERVTGGGFCAGLAKPLK
jgi:outer membrane protein TolC